MPPSSGRAEPIAQPPSCMLVIPSFAGGGAERVMLQLAGSLPAHGLRTELLALSGAGPLRQPGVELCPTTILDRPRMRGALSAIFHQLRVRRPTLVFSSFGHVTAGIAAMLPLLRSRPKLIAREPNLPSLSMAGGGVNRWLRLACRLAYPRCDLVVASSERMAIELRDEYAVQRERLLVLPNPVDVSMIRARAECLPERPGCRRLFVAAGRLVPQKGFDRLITRWRQTDVGDHLIILGDGPDRQSLQRQLANAGLNGRVQLRGFDANPWAWYALADAVLLPSRFEGMPNVALEALACGTPVIATPESGGIAELVPRVGVAALKVVPMDAFVGTMSALEPSALVTPGSLRPSLLPTELHPDRVAATLATRLLGLVG
jgi:glycosyltransferase involved in cell wall biosynthesis